MRYLDCYTYRRALSTGLAVLMAAGINTYFSFSQGYWMVAAAFLVCQTTRSAVFSQYIKYLFFLLLIALVLPMHSMQAMQHRVIDIGLGGLIGILFSQFVLPVRPYYEFCQGVLPLLRALAAEKPPTSTAYPEWVYEVGFNPGLRSGFRFFLIQLDYIIEIFFSLKYLRSMEVNESPLSLEIAEVMRTNIKLLDVMIDFFSQQKWTYIDADFTSDIVAMEVALQRVVPSNLELLDTSMDHIVLTAIVRDMKDMRELLLKLVMTLPAPK